MKIKVTKEFERYAGYSKAEFGKLLAKDEQFKDLSANELLLSAARCFTNFPEVITASAEVCFNERNGGNYFTDYSGTLDIYIYGYVKGWDSKNKQFEMHEIGCCLSDIFQMTGSDDESAENIRQNCFHVRYGKD